MAELIAEGPNRRDRWRRRLDRHQTTVRVGRDSGNWSVPWDACISRVHAELNWDGQSLQVARLPRAQNPIFFQGKAADRFELSVGEHFVIGRTQFRLVDELAQVSMLAPIPVSQQTFSAEYLRQARFQHAQQQVQALTRLPEIIAAANSEDELDARLVNLILSGILTARAAAVVAYAPQAGEEGELEILHWDSVDLTASEFQPSAVLIRNALRKRQSVVHHWRPGAAAGQDAGRPFDWAFCSPIHSESGRDRGIYVAGDLPTDGTSNDLQDALKFIELIGTTVGHVNELRRLQERTAALAQFFSPPIRAAVAAADPDLVLAPRQAELTVLFCDLRGFTRHTEQAADDLFGLLQRVSEALGIMTRQILDFGGVVGDFHGDSAMGFWGWPLADDAQVGQACLAALAICDTFRAAAQQDRHALHGFRVGIGLATGTAVAGKLGTADQVKVTAFGPVVNLASRLEGLTRPLGVSILVDKRTAGVARQQLAHDAGVVRRVGRVQPYGMGGVEQVYELVSHSDRRLARGEADEDRLAAALVHFQAGRWPEAAADLRALPADDPIAVFYLRFLDQHEMRPPDDWDGVLRFDNK